MNKFLIGLIVVLIVITASLAVQNIKMNKQLKQMADEKEELMEKMRQPKFQAPQTANPAEASPFDKPNNDPVADRYNTEGTSKTQSTTVRFDRLVHDFGRINEGEKVKTTFKITNTGEYGLLIYHAQSTCGCTVPDWPRYPIKKGATGDINVEFDSEGKHGEIMKNVTISANTEPPMITLTIKATVIPKDK